MNHLKRYRPAEAPPKAALDRRLTPEAKGLGAARPPECEGVFNGLLAVPTTVTGLRRFLLIVVTISLLASPVVAPVPEFAADNTSPESPHVIDPATKFWAIDDTLAREQVTC